MHGAGIGIDACDVAGPPVGSWACDAKTLALSDGEAVHAIVFGEHRATRVDDRAAAHADARAKKRAGVPRRDEADVMTVGLLGHGQPATGGFLANLRLRCVADRERRMA